MNKINETFYTPDRKVWRAWLAKNFDKKAEIWLVYPKQSSGKPCILYNDAVEEALCFGWIDSIIQTLDEANRVQRFTPRNPRSSFSQQNKERLKWLAEQNMLHPSVQAKVIALRIRPWSVNKGRANLCSILLFYCLRQKRCTFVLLCYN